MMLACVDEQTISFSLYIGKSLRLLILEDFFDRAGTSVSLNFVQKMYLIFDVIMLKLAFYKMGVHLSTAQISKRYNVVFDFVKPDLHSTRRRRNLFFRFEVETQATFIISADNFSVRARSGGRALYKLRHSTGKRDCIRTLTSNLRYRMYLKFYVKRFEENYFPMERHNCYAYNMCCLIENENFS